MAFAQELRAIARREARSVLAVLDDFALAPFRSRPALRWIVPSPARLNLDEFTAAGQDHGRDEALVNRKTYFDVRWGNAKIILGYADRSSMAHSLEARVPYFDRRFVELLFRLPDHYKIDRGERKRVLRDVARRHVSPRVTERHDRMGFGVPDEEMLVPSLRDELQDDRLGTILAASGVIRGGAFRSFRDDYFAGRHVDHRAIWRVYALEKWSRLFDVSW